MEYSETHSAFVVATQHDWPTRYVYAAAVEAQKMLRSRFALIKRLPPDATASSSAKLFKDLLARKALREQQSKIVVGYLSAHGSTSGLIDENSQVLFDHSCSAAFDDAILVVTACSQCEEAELIVKDGTSVQAVIGFQKKLQVPPDQIPERWYPSRLEFHHRFCDALVQPVRTLVEKNGTSTLAWKDGFIAWKAMADDSSFDSRLRHIAETNRNRLFHKGVSSALPL